MRLRSSIQKHAESSGGAAAGGVGAKPSANFFKISVSPECITKVKYKINDISKNKNRTKKTSCTQKFVSEDCAYLSFLKPNGYRILKTGKLIFH